VFSPPDAVGEAEVEEHALGDLAHHFARLEVDHEERLDADELFGPRALLLHPRKDRPRVIAEVHRQAQQLVGLRDFLDAFDRADPEVDRREGRERNGRFDRCGCHGVIFSRKEKAPVARGLHSDPERSATSS
jgi:hypothetical protein